MEVSVPHLLTVNEIGMQSTEFVLEVLEVGESLLAPLSCVLLVSVVFLSPNNVSLLHVLNTDVRVSTKAPLLVLQLLAWWVSSVLLTHIPKSPDASACWARVSISGKLLH